MPGNNFFQFKHFKIIQEKSAMRVGTDGVLLGAWADVSGAQSILDVGTGTGLIALMLAQRSNVKITGVEIEKNAAEEAASNSLNSPWPERLQIIHQPFQEYAKSAGQNFDLIVSNPPFYTDDLRPKKSEILMARHTDKLPLHDLANWTEKLLLPEGKLAIILPVFSAMKFIKLAESYDLNLSVLTEVKPNQSKPTHRYLMEFRKTKIPVKKDELSIRNVANDDFTTEYKTLTKDFYLNF